MADQNKRISIIIPTTRLRSVTRTINSIIPQVRDYDYELIVVGKGVTVLKSRFSTPQLVYIESDRLYTPAQARNAGASRARGDILLFIDDDCEAAPGWLQNTLPLLVDRSIGIATGKIAGRSNGFFGECADLTYYLQLGDKRKELDVFMSGSFGIRKDVFNELEGFDEQIAVHEDTDFARRLREKGYTILYSPDIVVLHHHKRDSFGKFLLYRYLSGVLGGLAVPLKHKSGWKDRIKVSFKNFYFFLVFPLTAWGTYKQSAGILRVKKNLFLFLPFILLSHLCYQLGVLQWVLTCRNYGSGRGSRSADTPCRHF
jgi:GT2 family glycosyltransferase